MCLLRAAATALQQNIYTDYSPAGGDGFGVGCTPPGAQLPFAMMRLSPDTAFDNIALEWRHFGGYYYGELGEDGTLLVRFSHSPVLVAVLQFSSGQWSHTNALFSQCLINRMATTSTLGNILTSIFIFLQVIMRFVASLTPIWWALGWRIMGTLVSW